MRSRNIKYSEEAIPEPVTKTPFNHFSLHSISWIDIWRMNWPVINTHHSARVDNSFLNDLFSFRETLRTFQICNNAKGAEEFRHKWVKFTVEQGKRKVYFVKLTTRKLLIRRNWCKLKELHL